IRMHTGINAGMVLVERDAEVSSEHGALGVPISVASRLCDMAEAGEILIGGSLKDDASRFFVLEDRGSRRLKGFSETVRIYQVLAERKTPVSLHRLSGGALSMVGRKRELGILTEKALRLSRGRGDAVWISGDAGIGKSRLIEEFRKHLPGSIRFSCAMCLDYARYTPYFPISMIIRTLLGFNGELPREESVQARLSSLSIKPECRESLLFLCGIHHYNEVCAPESWKSLVSDAFCHLVETMCTQQPLVVCCEDIHWADRTSLDVLEYLVHMVSKRMRCLLLLSHRSGFRSSRSGAHLHLRDLSKAEISEMTRRITHLDEMPESMNTFLYQESGGNPLYLEEIVHYLIERGISLHGPVPLRAKNHIPVSIHGLLAARIDTLDETSRRVLQEASVIGKIFSKNLLAGISVSRRPLDACLQHLIDSGFIVLHDRQTYRFRHSLTQRVAYQGMLRKTRVRLHKTIAQLLEQTHGDRREGMADILAHHFFVGEAYEKAGRYSLDAARNYHREGSWVEAATHYCTAETCIERRTGKAENPRDLVEIWEGIWSCSRIFNPSMALGALESLARYYRDRGSRQKEAFAYIRLINLYSQKGLFIKARETYHRAIRLSRGDRAMTAAAQTAYAYTYTFLGKPTVALSYLARSREKIPDEETFLMAVNSLTTLASLVWKASIKEAFLWYTRTKKLTVHFMDLDLMADLWLGYLSYLTGDFAQAETLCTRIHTQERKLGALGGGLSYLRIQSTIYFNSRYTGNLKQAKAEHALFDERYGDMEGSSALSDLYQAWISLEEGMVHQAKEFLERALPRFRNGIANRVPYALNALAETYLHLGEVKLAERFAAESIDWNRKHGNKDQLVTANRLMGKARVRSKDFHMAAHFLKKNSRLVSSGTMKPHLAWDFSAWGDLHRAAGNHEKASACFLRALKLWQEMGSLYQVRKINTLLALVDTRSDFSKGSSHQGDC
ncbi:MAG: AAA family ATPase, partial [Desulfomonilia bacterium]